MPSTESRTHPEPGATEPKPIEPDADAAIDDLGRRPLRLAPDSGVDLRAACALERSA